MQRITSILSSLLSQHFKWIGLCVVTLAIYFNLNWHGITEGDTETYADIAINGLRSPYLHFRPLGYPLLIKLSYFISNSFTALIVMQALAYILSYILFTWFIAPRLFNSGKQMFIAILTITIAFLAPQSLAEISVVLPESSCILPLSIMLLLLTSTISYKTIIGLTLSGFSLMLLKPVWLIVLPALFILILFFAFKKQRKERNLIAFSFLSILILFGLNQLLIKKNSPQGEVLASTLNITINLSMIRFGLIDGAENTRLHQFLINQQLDQQVRTREWTNDSEELKQFTVLKNSIPWQYREDKSYWRSILKNNNEAFKFVLFQFSRTPYFFTTAASNRSVELTNSSTINYLYQGFYSRVHKVIIPLLYSLVLITLIIPKYIKAYNTSMFFGTILVLLFAGIITFVSFQNSLFLRFRSGIEPLLIICSILPILHLRNVFFDDIKNLLNRNRR